MSDEKTAIHGLKPLWSEDQTAHAYVIVISGGAAGKMFRLPAGECLVGRSSDAVIQLDDEGVSRRHVVLRREPDGSVLLVDQGSTNGTWVDGARVSERVLQDGDKFQIGSATILKLSYQTAVEEKFQQQLYDSGVRDGLTRIYNKRFFAERIREEFAYAARHGSSLSLLLFDVDHFKAVNDRHGHPAGDDVLRELAARISAAVRAEDVLCRYGGEEFAVIMRGLSLDRAVILAERLRRVTSGKPFSSGDSPIPVTISLGVAALLPGVHGSASELVAEADRELYRAKELGRNRVAAPGI